jgi:hypothetical protein
MFLPGKCVSKIPGYNLTWFPFPTQILDLSTTYSQENKLNGEKMWISLWIRLQIRS